MVRARDGGVCIAKEKQEPKLLEFCVCFHNINFYLQTFPVDVRSRGKSMIVARFCWGKIIVVVRVMPVIMDRPALVVGKEKNTQEYYE